ncbi:MAG: uracil-DNA glycosylase [Leptospirillia bacterium]
MSQLPELSGGEGLAVYLRYLQETVPDLALSKSSGRRAGERVPPPAGEAPPSSGGSPSSNEPLEALRSEASVCRLCGLAATRTHVVFGEGDPHAALMFVGEGPGADEDASGRPFVGRAGELLTRMIAAMGYRRDQVYIANVVKCRPPGNRVPEEAERAACKPYLARQIEIVSPRALVLLGQTAAASLLGRSEGISKLRGQETRIPGFPGIRTMPTYHPAYLLRNPSAKGQVWEDLKQVMDWLEKERG